MTQAFRPLPGESIGDLIARAMREVQGAENEKLAARLAAEGFTSEEIEQALADGREFVAQQMTGGEAVQ